MHAIAFFSILRPHNMLASALAVVAGAFIAGDPRAGGVVTAALLAALVTGAGNILNDCFDIDIDRINKPRRPLPSGRITRRAALGWYAAISILATAGAAFLVPRATGTLIMGWEVALALYAAVCKRWLVAGNVLVATISSSAFFAGALLAGNPRAALVPAAIAFAFVCCREIVKGAEDVEGDRSGGVRTLAVVLGERAAGTIAAVLMLVLAALIPLPALTLHYRAGYLFAMDLCVVPVLLAGALRVAGTSERAAFTRTSRSLKLGMFLGIVAIALGA
ncbi:MAG TPA: geranylgeranylglycerol-phosphate geranylgeranyltransferase [Candidatus Krumholzibacteria bacterium]